MDKIEEMACQKETYKHIKEIGDTKRLMFNRLRSAESAHDRFQNLVTSKHSRKARKIPSWNLPKMSGMKDVMSGQSLQKKTKAGHKKKEPLFSFMTTRLGWSWPVIHPIVSVAFGVNQGDNVWVVIKGQACINLRMIRATQKNPKKTSRFSGSAPSRLFFFRIPRNKKWSLGKKLVFRLSHLKASKKKCKKVKLKSRVSVSGNSGATNRDTLCFVIVQFHLEDMVVEVLLKMPCVKHGIRGENANLFWCLEEPKAVYFPPKKKLESF